MHRRPGLRNSVCEPLQPTQKKPTHARTRKTMSERMRKKTQCGRCHHKATEVRTGRATGPYAMARAGGVKREKSGGEERGKHRRGVT